MLKSLEINRVLAGAGVSIGVFIILQALLGINLFVVVLNGAFIGAGIAYAVAFSDILRDAIFGHGPYDRVRQMALGMMIVWVAVTVSIVASIYDRATGTYVALSEWTPVARYLAIVGGAVQITAPDVGMGFFYGRDRRLLFFAVGAGIVVAIVLVLLQT